MDVGKAFTFVFEDEEWIQKVLIGGVLVLTVIGIVPVMGYGMEIARRVVKGHPQPLPEWGDWGTKIIEGLLSWVVNLVWSLPLIIVSSCSWIVLIPLDDGSDASGVLYTLVMCCVGFIAFVYGLVLAFALPAALTHYAVTGEFKAAFQFGEIISIVRNNLVAYLLVIVVAFLASLIAFLGVIACFIGVVITAFYAILVTYHAYGQAYRIAAGNVESEVSPAY